MMENWMDDCMDDWSRPKYRIIVNSKDHSWNKDTISYDEIVKLVTGKTGLDIVYTITYSYSVGACGHKVQGSIVPGGIMETFHDMVINAYLTNNG